jgi:hypothetical protein
MNDVRGLVIGARDILDALNNAIVRGPTGVLCTFGALLIPNGKDSDPS